MKSISIKGSLIGVLTIISIIGTMFFTSHSITDEAMSLELIVDEAYQNIKAAIEARYVKLTNLADCVEEYSEYEAETLRNIINSRSGIVSTDEGETITQISTTEIKEEMKVIVEAYPELKADETYKTLMEEISTSENQILSLRTAYNNDRKNYNRYINKWLNRIIINFYGYEFEPAKELEYSTPEDGHLNLFDK